MSLTAVRPFYLIAHQCNDTSDIANAMKAGANGVELDVHLTKAPGDTDYHWWAYHDDITSPIYTRLDGWLAEAARVAAAYGDKFAIIYFDIKTPKVDGLVGLRDLARSILPPDLNLLFSTSDIPDAGDPFKGFGDYIRFNEGMAIDSDNSVGDVAKYFNDLGVVNCWYGDGISAEAPEQLTAIHSSVKAGVNARDIFAEVKKVYVWTLADLNNIESYLDMGVDAILVEANPGGVFIPQFVEATAAMIQSRGEMRMATRSDFAFSVTSMGPTMCLGDPGSIAANWKGWPANFVPDAAITWANGHAYFFSGDQYIRYDPLPLDKITAGPSSITAGWPGWPKDFYPLDAALFWPPTGKAYFFKGDQYIRYSPQYDANTPEGVDPGYPKAIKDDWPGLESFLPLDGAIYWPRGFVYFFKGNQYVEYSPGITGAEGVSGSPLAIGNGWNTPDTFHPINGGVYLPNGLAYMLSGSQYVRYRSET